MTRRLLVTAALPYANGSIHIGHLVEYIQTDIWVRFQKMCGHDCIYCCADDTHGTPIMIRARKEGITPEQLIAAMHLEHQRDFAQFDIAFDSYYSTHSEENRQCSETIYSRLKQGGHITTREVEQAYCDACKMFLPDRFIRGTCPKCGAADQYGDSCEACHGTYSPVDLKDAKCSVCGTPPVRKESKHYFFKLADFADQLKQWIDAGHVHPQIQNKLREWFDQGLRDWDISRDAPYFGFKIPGEQDKYFYVWLDAPIGYMASTMNYCKQHGKRFEDYWCEPGTEIHHFIGKDITYFHALFWPAMLMGSNFNTPTNLAIHGFLTVNGEKMSKSRGTFINAATYLKHLDPQHLRYYYACKLGPGIEDIDLNTNDFIKRVSSDLVGKIANLASRSIQMLNNKLKRDTIGKIPTDAEVLLKTIQKQAASIAEYYETRQFARAMREICAQADEVNRYFDDKKPWNTIYSNPDATHNVLTVTLNAVRLLTLYLKPVLPSYAAKIERMLKINPLCWNDAEQLLENHPVGDFERLIERVDPEKVKMMIDASKEEQANQQPAQPSGPLIEEPLMPEISYDDFAKVDLRVAKVIKAEHVEGADKLLRLELDLGGQTRQVFAGIKKAYAPEALLGKHMIVVANLAPRKMKFGLSEGMILASGPGGEEVFALTVDPGAKPGQRIH